MGSGLISSVNRLSRLVFARTDVESGVGSAADTRPRAAMLCFPSLAGGLVATA